jgi:hypothetical protein
VSYPQHLGHLNLSKHGARQWQLINEFRYWINDRYHIVIESGFVCDLASIPRIVTPLIPQIGKHCWAALVHDYLYEYGYVRDEQGRQHRISRLDADLIFYHALLYFGVGPTGVPA